MPYLMILELKKDHVPAILDTSEIQRTTSSSDSENYKSSKG